MPRQSYTTATPTRLSPVQRLRRIVFVSALLILAASVVTFVAWRRPLVVQAASAQVRFVGLPDGSRVALNSGSTLRYRRNFQRLPFLESPRRGVWLEGEAFFTVQPDERPFVVVTHNAEVTVLGSSFNVRARRGEGEGATRVSVVKGRVGISSLEADESVELTANQSTRVDDAALPPAPPQATPAALDARWRSGAFVVRDLPLAAVLAEVERRFNVRVTWEGALPSSEVVTLHAPDPNGPEDILRTLASARSLEYRTTGRRSFAVEPAR